MQLEKSIDVARSRDQVVELLSRDETLVRLMTSGETEIIESDGDRRTTRTQYRALGREGVATFHFTYLMDGGIRFEKVCDGRVWRELRGEVSVDETSRGGSSVKIELVGRTKSLVPEFTIKGPMEEQIAEMTQALSDLLEES
jgi:hypothetical protein